MINFGISPAKQKNLEERFERLGIKETDIGESFTRASGNGGQNVNKVETAVQLRHVSGIEIKAQKYRTQLLNRYYARVLLADKLEEKLLGAESKKRREIEKIRRQKRKRSKRAKEKMLFDKKKTAEKKLYRGKINA